MKKILLILSIFLSISNTLPMEPKKRILFESDSESKKVKIEESKSLSHTQNPLSKLTPDLQKYLIPFFSHDELEPIKNTKERQKIITGLCRFLYLIPQSKSHAANPFTPLEKYLLTHTADTFDTSLIDSALRLGIPSTKPLPIGALIGQQEELDTCLKDMIFEDNTRMIKNLGKSAPHLVCHFFNSDDYNGYTLLRYATFFKRVESIKALLEIGADINYRRNGQNTALLEAAYTGRLDLIPLLLAHGADANIQDEVGNTALIAVSRYPWAEDALTVIKKLIAAGANVNIQNKKGYTALHFAQVQRNKEVIELLRHASATL